MNFSQVCVNVYYCNSLQSIYKLETEIVFKRCISVEEGVVETIRYLGWAEDASWLQPNQAPIQSDSSSSAVFIYTRNIVYLRYPESQFRGHRNIIHVTQSRTSVLYFFNNLYNDACNFLCYCYPLYIHKQRLEGRGVFIFVSLRNHTNCYFQDSYILKSCLY